MSDIPVPSVNRRQRNKYRNKVTKQISYGDKMNDMFPLLENFQNIPSYSGIPISEQNSAVISNQTNTNTKIDTYNAEREILIRNDELQMLENDSMENQLQHLQSIQSQILSKERLIEQNLYHADQNDKYIRMLSAFILLCVFIFIIFQMHGVGKIDSKKFIIFMGILILLFTLYSMYLYNIFYLKESVGRLFTLQFLSNIGQKIEQKTNDFNKQINTIKQGDYNEWVSKNCKNCSSNNNDSDSLQEEESSFVLEEEDLWSGIFYQDGSQPTQMLYPENTKETSGKYHNQIHYPDYSIFDGTGKPNINRVGPIDGSLTGVNIYTSNL